MVFQKSGRNSGAADPPDVASTPSRMNTSSPNASPNVPPRTLV